MREAPRDLHADIGRAPGAVVIATAPVRIGLDRRHLRALRADLIGRRARSYGKHQRRAHGVGVADGPLQRAGPAHRAADDRGDLGDAQRCQRGDIRLDLVAHRHLGEPRSPRLSVRRRRTRTRRPAEAAKHIGGDRAPAIGVDRRAGSCDALPPAFCLPTRTDWTGDM
jgi:hypothetical protein